MTFLNIKFSAFAGQSKSSGAGSKFCQGMAILVCLVSSHWLLDSVTQLSFLVMPVIFLHATLWSLLWLVFNSIFNSLSGVFIVLELRNLLSSCRLNPVLGCTQNENVVQHHVLGKQHFCEFTEWTGILTEQNIKLMTYFRLLWSRYAGWVTGFWEVIFEISSQY